nr:hypothetical protein [Rhizobium skierniewicense]
MRLKLPKAPLPKCRPRPYVRRRRNEQQATGNRPLFRQRSQHSSARIRAGLQDIRSALASACTDFTGRHQERDHRSRLRAWYAQSAG